MQIEDRPSPNWGDRRGDVRPDMIVLHYTGMEDAAAALRRLADPAAEVSAHYVVDEHGRAFRMVDEARRAWHAGRAFWAGVRDVNSASVGIEMVNPGHAFGYRPFPWAQMRAVEALVRDVAARWSVPPERVVGHGCVAPGRKIDPGERFDWRALARAGVAVWADAHGSTALSAGAFQRAARQFGYGVPESGAWDAATLAVWDAFARRFRPAAVGGPPDGAGLAQLQVLADRWPGRLDAARTGF